MKRGIATQWVQALRSGDYQQGKEVLRANDSFCCLGVLCELHRQENGGEWVPAPRVSSLPAGSQKYNTPNGDWDHSMLPDAVRDWAGLRSNNPSANGERLTVMNDEGRDFSDLADIIESCAEEL